MSAATTAARYLTKRPREEKEDTKAAAADSPTKRARINEALLHEKFWKFAKGMGAIPVATIAAMHQLLTRNLSLTDKLFAKNQADTRIALRVYLVNKVPKQCIDADPYLDTYLAPTQALQLKELIALALIRGWLDVREVPDRLYLLPLFTTDALPSYKSFIAEVVAENTTNPVLEFDGLVNGAYATNNVHLLQWCLDLCDGDFQPVIPRRDFVEAATSPHKNLAYEETQAWMAANVPMRVTPDT